MNQILDNPSFQTAQSQTAARQFFAKVYAFMFGALLISGGIAYQFGTEAFFEEYFVTPATLHSPASLSPLFYIIAFAPLGLALLMQTMINRLSYPVLILLFASFSILLGLSLTTIFLQYSTLSIVSTFFVTAGSFAGMAILGYTTKIDLTKFGSLLYMAFIGIFIAGIVNMFVESDGLGFVISVIGVFVFTGLTAYHMQQLKEVAFNTAIPEKDRNKMALIGGLTLYILFVNLFLSLLRLLGGRE